jgi:hypothetical protein
MLFHFILCLYGLFLVAEFPKWPILQLVGVIIIYQHLYVLYLGFPRIPIPIITAGGLLGVVTGLEANNWKAYAPLLYSFLSKIPTYAVTLSDHLRVIAMVILFCAWYRSTKRSLDFHPKNNLNIQNYK